MSQCNIFYRPFLRATARSAKRILAILFLSVCPSIRLSVCLSVRLSRPGTDSSPGEIETPGLYHMMSYKVSSFLRANFVPVGEEIPLKRGHQSLKEVYPLRNRHFTAISLSRVRTVADRHILAAYQNKHCWRAFGGTNVDDLEQRQIEKYRALVNFSRFQAATHIWRMNFRWNY